MAQLHEYKAKQILSSLGIEIPRGKLASTPDEAKEIANEIGGRVVVKAQIHTTSRAALGGIKFATSGDEALAIAETLIGL